MARKRVSVIRQSKTGRNVSFRDNYSKKNMTRSQFVSQIKSGNYPNFPVRNINGVPTPVSNPDGSKHNNLG